VVNLFKIASKTYVSCSFVAYDSYILFNIFSNEKSIFSYFYNLCNFIFCDKGSNKIPKFWDFFDKKLLVCKCCGSEFEVNERAKFILSGYEWISVLLWLLVVTFVQILIDEKEKFSLTSVIVGTLVFVVAQSIILLLIPYKMTKIGREKA
jgi:hypothetical protein